MRRKHSTLAGALFLPIGLLVLGVFTGLAYAQSSAGGISGYVTTDDGKAVVGATLTLESPALIRSLSAVSGERGFYRFPSLPPGEFTITVKKEGYSQYVRRGLTIKAGLNIRVDVPMTVGEFSQEIVITAEAPLLEVENVEKTWNFEGEFLRSLPLSPDNSWEDVMTLVPGAYLSNGTTYEVEMHGSSSRSNVPMLDGVNVGDAQYNRLGDTVLPAESIEDIAVVAGYSSASSPAGSGARINVVTKSGGDNFHGEFSFDMQTPSWNDVNVDEGTPADETIYRPSFSIGGPVVRESLWFFSNFRYGYVRSGISRTAADIQGIRIIEPGFEPFDRKTRDYAWQNKLTWRALDDVQFVFNYLYNSQRVRNSANVNETLSGTRNTDYGGPLYSAQGRWQMTENASINATFGWKEGGLLTGPSEENVGGPQITWYEEAYKSGRYMRGRGMLARTGNITGYNDSDHDRITVSTDFEYFLEDLKGSHVFKAGMFLQPVIRDFVTQYSSNNGLIQEYRALIDPTDASKGYNVFYQKVETPTVLPGVQRTSRQYDFYVSDTWRPSTRLTLNVGLKASKVLSYDTFGREGLNSFGWGGSVGFTYQLTSDGQNIVRGGFSRTPEPVANISVYNPNSYRKGYTQYHDYDLDGVWDYEYTVNPVLSSDEPSYPVDKDLSQPLVDEISLGYQRQLPWRTTVDFAYYHKELSRLYGRLEVNGIYDASGNIVDVIDQDYGLVYQTTNIKNSKIVFDGFEVNINKDLSQRFRFLAGYAWSHAACVGEYEDHDPARLLQPGTFPNNRGVGSTSTNAQNYGDAYDQYYHNSGVAPHMFKFGGVCYAPLGIVVSANYVWQMGRWQGAILTEIDDSELIYDTHVVLPNGKKVENPIGTTYRFAYATRSEGQERAPAYTYLNLRVAKEFMIRDYRVEVAANVFNVFNRGEDISWNSYANRLTIPSRFGTLGYRQSPRAGQLNIRVTF